MTWKDQKVAALWLGLTCSSVGDEMYKLGVLWAAFRLSEHYAGFLPAIECFAVVAVGLLLGPWSDRKLGSQAMLFADAFRTLVLIVAAVCAWSLGVGLSLLLLASAFTSGLSALFDPALQHALVHISVPGAARHRLNALMESTRKTATVVGPLLAALAFDRIGIAGFFMVAAGTFALSGAAVLYFGVKLKSIDQAPPKTFPKGGVRFAIRLLRQKDLSVLFLGWCAVWGIWSLGFSYALPLHVKQQFSESLGTLGTLYSVYGLSNLGAAILFPKLHALTSTQRMRLGLFNMAFGFALCGMAHVTWLAILGAAICATGAPLFDLEVMHLFQEKFETAEVPSIMRFRLMFGSALIFLLFLLSPWLVSVLSGGQILLACGVALAGYLLSLRKRGESALVTHR